MGKPLRILHLEDQATDAELVAREIKIASLGADIKHVENKEDFIIALREFTPDVILSDHSLPSLDSHEALRILKSSELDIPFILVTATVSEEYAVKIMKEGAVDYILKDRLQRLPTAILGALEKHTLEQEKKKADELLRSSQRKYKLIFKNNPLPMWVIEKEMMNIVAVNDAAIEHYGYTEGEFLKKKAVDLRPREEQEKYLSFLQSEFSRRSNSRIWKHLKKDGTVIMVEIFAHDIEHEGMPARIVLAHDITEKLRVEEDLARQQIQQQKLIREISIKVQEREREEIGRELHDNINQLLAASKMYIDLAIKKTGSQNDYFVKSQENIQLAISEIRKLSHSLVAPSLEYPLIHAITKIMDDIRAGTSLELILNSDGFQEQKVDPDITLMLFRTIQEQLNNVVKHAQAKKVMVKLQGTAEVISLFIEDDGVGFDNHKAANGIGLGNISNRVHYFDGEMKIITSPGKGCRMEITVPLPQAANKA
jgi:two-component system sensor histidine kinase UhpB